MSGDTPCDIGAIWKCPFCGKSTHHIQLPAQYGEGDQGSDGFDLKYEGREPTAVVILRIECSDKDDAGYNSALYTCPAMSEMGAYNLHIYPDGHCHAYYY